MTQRYNIEQFLFKFQAIHRITNPPPHSLFLRYHLPLHLRVRHFPLHQHPPNVHHANLN